MKVAVLGAAGWLGRAVLTHLEEHGHQVRAIDYGPEAWKAWEDVDGTYGGEIIHADISDYDQMVSALEAEEGSAEEGEEEEEESSASDGDR